MIVTKLIFFDKKFKMKNLPRLFIIFIIIIFASCSPKQKANKPSSSQSPALGYTSEAAFFCKIKALDNGDKEKIFIHAELKRGYEQLTIDQFINRFAGTYILLPDYNKKEFLATGSIFLTKESVKIIGENVFAISIEIAKPNAPQALLKLEISDLETKQKSGDELIIRLNAEKVLDKFAIFDYKTNFPLMTSYSHIGDSIIVKDLVNSKKTFRISYFKNNFGEAPSPMAVGSHSVVTHSSPADSTFQWQANHIVSFRKVGLYFFTEASDTINGNGISIYIGDNRYPRFTKAHDLIKPIIYISSNEEINEVKKSTDAKKTLDHYWIKLANGNEDAARQSIKLYYRRVMLANQLFTTYKEGWKTDLGMVYTVFGPPDKINKLKDRQIWTYTQNSNFSEINFTFIKRKSAFTESEYELQRYNEYEPIWFPVVDGWRTGAIY